jgi:3-hydroxybutyryl-CoA dehydrogenase
MKEKITLIGAGLMGRGLSQVFSLSGHEVGLYDAFAEARDAAVGLIEREMKLGVEAGLLDAATPAGALARITVFDDLARALEGAELVIEAVPEKMDLKQNVFKTMDEICPLSVILASNTSVMSITRIASASTHKNRILGTHFWNPPHLLPLVEVVQTVDTDPEAVRKTMDILRGAGKKPIHVKKDVPGFVANRMQHALWREAFHILDQGIADAATIDEAVRSSFGLRLPVLAPMENADMVGLDLTLDIHNYILQFLADNKTPSPTLQAKVKAGELGFKSGGIGLQKWTGEDIAASRTGLSRYLMEVAVRAKNSR